MDNIEIRVAKKKEIKNWFNHCSKEFDIPSQFFSVPYNSDIYDNVIFVAMKDEKIISGIRTLTRDIYINKKIYKVWGITDAATTKRFRNTKLIVKLFEFAKEYYKNKEVNICILFTYERAKKIFYSLGFKNILLSYSVFSVDNGYIDKSISLRKLQKNDIRKIYKIYNDNAYNYNCTIKRSYYYWINWVLEMKKYIYIIEFNNNVCGYIICDDIKRNTIHGNYLRISEYFIDSSLESIYFNILHQFVSQFHFPYKIKMPYPITKEIDIIKEYDSAMWIADFKNEIENMDLILNNTVYFNTDRF